MHTDRVALESICIAHLQTAKSVVIGRAERVRLTRCASMLVLLLLLLVGNMAYANTAFVIVGGQGLTFSPQSLDISAGDTVTFLNFGGVHNVVADDGSFRCAHGCDNDGHGGSGAATGQLWFVSIVFPKAGTVGYFCETHGTPGTGMFGTINVTGAAPPPLDPSAVPLGGMCLLLLAIALLAGAAPWLRRTRRTR
jgi:plastocyanin